MPCYDYKCPEHGEFDIFFKSLPSEKKQKEAPCPDCDAPSPRLLGRFFTTGTQHGGMEEAAGLSMDVVDIGGRQRPAFRDNNGRLHEVKSSKDIDMWRRNNQLGRPRMVEWTNQKTGEKSWVPMRTKMHADPDTGEQMDVGSIIKDSEPIVPLDNSFDMPSESRTGVPIDQKTGVSKAIGRDPVLRHGATVIPDPATGKPMKMSDMWGSPVKSADQGDTPSGDAGQLKEVHKVMRKMARD